MICYLSEFDVKEIHPPGMDISGKTKYPVLFGVYEDTFLRNIPAPCADVPRLISIPLGPGRRRVKW